MSEDDDNAYNIGSLVVQMQDSGTPKEQLEEFSSSKDNFELSIDEIEPSFFMGNTNGETPEISSMIEAEDGQTHFMKVSPIKPIGYSSSQAMTVLPYSSACTTPMTPLDYHHYPPGDIGTCDYSLPEEEAPEPSGASMLPTISEPCFSARQSVSVLKTRNVPPNTQNSTNDKITESSGTFKSKMRQDSGFDESFKGSEKMEESFEEEFEEFPPLEHENEKLNPSLLNIVAQLKSNNVTQILENYREQYPETKNLLHAHMNRLSLLGAILSNEYVDKTFPTSSSYNQTYEYSSTNNSNNSVHSSNEVTTKQVLQNETINGGMNREESSGVPLLRSHVNPSFKVFKYSERFSCTKCDYSSFNKSNYKNHLLIHSDERMFACPYCSYRGKQSAGLRAHLKVHSVDKPFTCSFCSYKCKRKQNLIQHLRIHSKHRPFHCDYCGYKCTTKQSLQKHMIRHFDKSHVNENTLGSQSENELPGKEKFEVGNSQTKYEEPDRRENVDYSEVSLGPNDSILKCLRCDFHTKRKCALKNHLKTHVFHDISCLFCNYTCESELQLILHLKSHQTSKDDQCKSCNFTPISNSDFVTHFYYHKSPKVVPVDVPPLNTNRINDYTKEVQSKPDKKSLQCPYCATEFDTIICLKLHINSHSDQDFLKFERPKAATDCHNSSKSTDSYMGHNMIASKSCNLLTANEGNTLESIGKETAPEGMSEFPKERQYVKSMTSNSEEKPSPLPHLTNFFKNGCPNGNNNNSNNNNINNKQNYYKQMVEKASHNLNIKNRLKWRLQTLNQLKNNSAQTFEPNSIEKKPMVHNAAIKFPEDSVVNCKKEIAKSIEPEYNEDGLISEQVISNSSGKINDLFIECNSENIDDIEGMESTDEGNVSSHLIDSFDPIGVSTPHLCSARFPSPSPQLSVASGSGELRLTNDNYNRNFKGESVRESQLADNTDKIQDKNYTDESKVKSDSLSSGSAHCKDNNIPSSSGPEENLIKDFDSKFSTYEFEDEISFDDLSEKNRSSDLDEESVNTNDQASKGNESSSIIPLNLIPKEVNKIMTEYNEILDDKSEGFQCNVCDAKFRRKSSLVNHKRSHAKEFFTCPKCPITFRYKRALVEHEKIHYINKTYKCTECDFSSMRKCSLMSHYRSHRKKFSCMYCDFKCSLIKKMEKHYQKHKMNANAVSRNS